MPAAAPQHERKDGAQPVALLAVPQRDARVAAATTGGRGQELHLELQGRGRRGAGRPKQRQSTCRHKSLLQSVPGRAGRCSLQAPAAASLPPPWCRPARVGRMQQAEIGCQQQHRSADVMRWQPAPRRAPSLWTRPLPHLVCRDAQVGYRQVSELRAGADLRQKVQRVVVQVQHTAGQKEAVARHVAPSDTRTRHEESIPPGLGCRQHSAFQPAPASSTRAPEVTQRRKAEQHAGQAVVLQRQLLQLLAPPQLACDAQQAGR